MIDHFEQEVEQKLSSEADIACMQTFKCLLESGALTHLLTLIDKHRSAAVGGVSSAAGACTASTSKAAKAAEEHKPYLDCWSFFD